MAIQGQAKKCPPGREDGEALPQDILSEIATFRKVLRGDRKEFSCCIKSHVPIGYKSSETGDIKGKFSDDISIVVCRYFRAKKTINALNYIEKALLAPSQNSSKIKSARERLLEIAQTFDDSFSKLRSFLRPGAIGPPSNCMYDLMYMPECIELATDDTIDERCDEAWENLQRKPPAKLRKGVERYRVQPRKSEQAELLCEGGQWNIRNKPTAKTVGCVNLKEIVLNGPIMVELPNRSETIFYRVPVYSRTARGVLLAIHKFYQQFELEYGMGNTVDFVRLKQSSPDIYRLFLRIKVWG
ncbi:hypothetical protein GQ44DRAFT_731113 [Phaeosphaeriaceae sp. PMI808]|nr:hypothetical protein GQ44DRAFT_796269 [Phaeosphaeriaceae sp. PMI808]KAH8710237.1 hypothetical protein GQ44DRAFT_731113 [Phaeosphaeriaceae sp. PMI808]